MILAAYAHLRLAKGLVADGRLPWVHPLPPRKLTPTRALRSFPTLTPMVGTLARVPKDPLGRPGGQESRITEGQRAFSSHQDPQGNPRSDLAVKTQV
jgi:hypothetical protein